jgi:hypothetical protein
MRSILFILIILTGVGANPVSGLFSFDGSYRGTAVLPFLKLPVGARSVAMGDFLTVLDYSGSMIYWNPARLGDVQEYLSYATHAELFGELRHEYIATTFPLGRSSLGASANAVHASNFTRSRDIQENPVDFSTLDLAVSLAWGIPLTERLNFGMRGSMLHSRIERESGYSGSLDLFGLWKIAHRMQLGVSLENISPGFSYGRVTEHLPLLIRAGIGQNHGVWSTNWILGISKSSDGIHQLHLGLERPFFGKLDLRAGYVQSFFDEQNGKLARYRLGAGYKWGGVQIDYALRWLDGLGLHQNISLGLAGIAPRPPEPKDYFALARSAYEKGDCRTAILQARRDLQNTPNRMESMLIIQQCTLRDAIEKGPALTLLFTGGIQGRIHARREPEFRGGLDRLTTLIQQLNATYANSILMDAGRTWGADAQMNYKAASILERLPYDVIPEASDLQAGALNRAGWQVRYWFVGGLEQAEQLRRELSEQEAGVLKIVLCTLGYADVRRLIHSAPGMDLVVTSGLTSGLAQPVEERGVYILAPDPGAESVVRLTLYGNRDLKRAHRVHRLHQVDVDLFPDSLAASIMGMEYVQEGYLRNIQPVEAMRRQVVYHRKLRDGRSDIYLWIPGTNFKIRMNDRPGYFTHTALGVSRNSFVTIAKNTPQESGGRLMWQEIESKSPKMISQEGEVVHYTAWDSYENWIYFAARNLDGTSDLFRVNPLGMERQNLSRGRFGLIYKFNFARTGRMMAFESFDMGVSRIFWSGTLLQNPVMISPDGKNATNPVVSDASRRVAFMVEEPDELGLSLVRNLYVYMVDSDSLIRVTRDLQVFGYAFIDEDRLVYSAGVNVPNLNVYQISTSIHTVPPGRRSLESLGEYNPRPYKLYGENGILYEVRRGGESTLRWVSIEETSLLQQSHLLDWSENAFRP